MAKNFLENGFLGYGIGEIAKEPNAYITPGYPLFLSFIYFYCDNLMVKIDLIFCLTL